MSTFERSIVSIIDPKITVDKIIQADIESDAARNDSKYLVPSGVHNKNSSRFGVFFPLIFINTIRFDADNLIYMNLDLGEHIPKIQINLSDPTGKFLLETPTDGDVISLYLRAPDEDNQRPIRIDFDIIDISGGVNSINYSFTGIMKIPGFLGEICKDFSADNSFEHLQQVCENISLGFASNETGTNDKMSRLCAFETYHHFVDDMVKHTYKDDDSFFDWYIDPYYYLCLVNLNKQFSTEDKIEDVNINMASPMSGIDQEDHTKDTFKGSLILTNRSDRYGTNIFIENHKINNKTAKIWITQGYKKYSQYYDIHEDNVGEYVSTFVDPFTTQGAESDLLLPKGRVKDDFYKSQIKYKWLGKQADSNTHPNYIFAQLLNNQNLQELKKTSLDVQLSGMNFYVYKYMRIPVLIYENAEDGINRIGALKKRDADLGEDDYDSSNTDITGTRPNEPGKPNKEKIGGDPRDQIKNEHLSGYYVVNSINYTFRQPGPVKMNLNLVRREWPIAAKNNNL